MGPTDAATDASAPNRPAKQRGTAFVYGRMPDTRRAGWARVPGFFFGAMPHELGHILTGKADSGGHYVEDEAAPSRRIGDFNLMYWQPRSGDFDSNGDLGTDVWAGKRLWHQQDKDDFCQIDEILTSPYLWDWGE